MIAASVLETAVEIWDPQGIESGVCFWFGVVWLLGDGSFFFWGGVGLR